MQSSFDFIVCAAASSSSAWPSDLEICEKGEEKRSTMPEQYDLIVVGGGLGGATLAKCLAEKGARVLVLERQEEFKDRVRGELVPP